MALPKQVRAFHKVVENGRDGTNLTLKQIMLDSGYSLATAIKPSRVTKSLGWQELMDKYVPDDMLVNIGLQGLQATKRDQYTGEQLNDWTIIHKFWSDLLERKHPKSSTLNLQFNQAHASDNTEFFQEEAPVTEQAEPTPELPTQVKTKA